jgi:Na+/H+-dicarboxylate symporter
MNKLTKNLTFWVFIGAVLGYMSSKLFGNSDWVQMSSKPVFYELVILLKSMFIDALKMMIAPVIFFSLVGGLIGIGEITKLKKMGGVTITYYLSTTIIAIIIGLTAVFFVHPWKNSDVKIKIQSEVNQTNSKMYKAPKKLIDKDSDSVLMIIKGVFEKAFVNPFKALNDGNILGIVTCALFIGLALLTVHSRGSPLHQLTLDINNIINQILKWIIKTTPIGVFAIAFDFQLKTSGGIIEQLVSFCVLVFVATMIHGLIVLPAIAWFFAGVSPKKLFTKAAKPILVAFSTSSSSATLPITMQTCEEEFEVSEAVSGFVFPLGATMNMDGTALFEGIAAVFLAHLYGIDLSPIATFSIFFMSMLSSIGAPGMPSASMSGMQMVLLSAGIPLEAIGILIVIDKPLDTFRTAVNVEGDIIGALVTQNYLNKKQASS